MIQPERIQRLNREEPGKGAYVLYWMQASQRADCNHALEYAIDLANERKEPLVVYFGLTDGYPDANLRHYRFMLEGLIETQRSLHDRGITLVVRHEHPPEGAVKMAADASVLVCDRGYLRFQREWRRAVSEQAMCPVIQVETDAIVPLETASNHEEYSAATLRKKLVPLLLQYLTPVEEHPVHRDSSAVRFDGIDITDIEAVLRHMEIDRTVMPAPDFRGGTSEALRRLNDFIEYKLDFYEELRNDPNENVQSGLSPYLHFGQVSPLRIALEVNKDAGQGADAFLEELAVRRELSLNLVHSNEWYDTFECLPQWARNTLMEHAGDHREYTYSLDELEAGHTHDIYWNAAQREMATTGKMHGYLRMYWGKKLLEWGRDPREAFRTALYLNNKYELDGRDPNGYAGVAWCFGKHDRPWASRPVFGTVRYMNSNGLKRKFDADRYAARFSAT